MVSGGLLGFVFLLLTLAPSRVCGQELIRRQRDDAAKRSLVGSWVADVGKTRVELRFTGEGRFFLDGVAGEYSVVGGALKLAADGAEVTYQLAMEKDQLTLSGGDLAQPMEFSRQPEAMSLFAWLFDFSLEASRRKLYRVLLILAVVVVSRCAIILLRGLSHAVVLSDWGPLRFVYRRHKNRALTIHSLILNVVKYVIYFTALGFVLGELGVNYTAYLASLSVIGLAIAFGSQGLVQDMVTGFFVVFEGQFDVGDMVEIGGQTGVVEELGLRMTRLRNYLGEMVVIPNRNISLVGNFSRGAQQAYVDVAASSREAAEREVELLGQVGRELRRQFQGVILAEPEALAPISLATGEHFVRLQVAIWPKQQWVVEQQLVARIREALAREGFEVPGDRVVVFYHAREEQPVSRWGRRREGPAGG